MGLYLWYRDFGKADAAADQLAVVAGVLLKVVAQDNQSMEAAHSAVGRQGLKCIKGSLTEGHALSVLGTVTAWSYTHAAQVA